MPFKCPNCRQRTISFRAKCALVMGKPVQCSECGASVDAGQALTGFAGTATVLIMAGGPIFFIILLGPLGLIAPLVIFAVALVALFLLVVLLCPLWVKDESRSGLR